MAADIRDFIAECWPLLLVKLALLGAIAAMTSVPGALLLAALDVAAIWVLSRVRYGQ